MLNLTPLPLRGGKRDNFDKRVRQVGEPRQQFCVGSRDLVILLRIQAKAKAMPVKRRWNAEGARNAPIAKSIDS